MRTVPTRIPTKYLQIASAIFCLCVLIASPLRAQKVERWIHSGFTYEYNYDLAQFNNEANYPTVLENTDVVQMFVNDVENQGLYNPEVAMPRFATRLALYRKHGIRLAVEGDPALNPDWMGYDAYCHSGVTCSAQQRQIPRGHPMT
jgi:hypothetical protein